MPAHPVFDVGAGDSNKGSVSILFNQVIAPFPSDPSLRAAVHPSSSINLFHATVLEESKVIPSKGTDRAGLPSREEYRLRALERRQFSS